MGFKPELTVKVEGLGDVRLRLPLGGLEDIAEVNPQLAEMAIGLTQGLWNLDEVKAVLGAGLKWAESEHTVADLFGAMPLRDCVITAGRLLNVAFAGVDPGEPEAADPPGNESTPSE